MVLDDTLFRDWLRERQSQLRRSPFLRERERHLLSSIFGMRRGTSDQRIPSDIIQSVVKQWMPLSPGMTMDELIQCRDQRHESFLSLKCAQEIKRQLSLCNRNEKERITLRNGGSQENGYVYALYYFDLKSETDNIVVVNVQKEFQASPDPRSEIWAAVQFNGNRRLKARVSGQTQQPEVNLQFDITAPPGRRSMTM